MRPGSEPSSKPWNGDRRPGRAMGKSMGINMEFIWILYLIYIYMMVQQNSFFRERPFFANKNVSFAKLSRTPCLSSAGPMLANNTSYEDSFTCQITPENHGSTCS
jgi:hypothetical protein